MPIIGKKKRILVPIGTPRQPSTGSRILMSVLRAILVPIFFVIGKIYKLCFGWLDERIARKNQDRFAQDVRTHLSFLFADHAAQVIPNEGVSFPPGFDGAYVTVAAETLLFRFARGRGDFGVEVASNFAPKNWEDLGLVIEATEHLKEPTEHLPASYRLESLGRILQPQFERLKEALSEERFEASLNEAVRIHNARTEEYVAKLHEQGITPNALTG
jgi:hypothetical protein